MDSGILMEHSLCSCTAMGRHSQPDNVELGFIICLPKRLGKQRARQKAFDTNDA